MSQKNLQKDRSRYFRQTDTLRLVGGALAIIGIAWYYFGYSYASYIIPTIITPIGVVLFILGSCRHIGDNDMDEEIQRLLLDYDQSVTSRADFSRLVLKHPSDVQTQAYVMQHPAQYFKRGKNSKPMSDICIKSHFFFTKDALLVCMRQLNLAQDPTDGGVSDNELALAFASIVKAEILEEIVEITFTNTKKKEKIRQYELVIWGEEGELLRLPVQNDMDTTVLCEDINKRIKRC